MLVAYLLYSLTLVFLKRASRTVCAETMSMIRSSSFLKYIRWISMLCLISMLPILRGKPFGIPLIAWLSQVKYDPTLTVTVCLR